MSRKSSARTGGPWSIGWPWPLNWRPSISVEMGILSTSPVNSQCVCVLSMSAVPSKIYAVKHNHRGGEVIRRLVNHHSHSAAIKNKGNIATRAFILSALAASLLTWTTAFLPAISSTWPFLFWPLPSFTLTISAYLAATHTSSASIKLVVVHAHTHTCETGKQIQKLESWWTSWRTFQQRKRNY